MALISLPCHALAVTASQRPGGRLSIHSGAKPLLTPQRARVFLQTLGLRLQGKVLLRADMPVGGGAGSSTAALVALARLAGWRGTPAALANACIRSEGATDPLMFSNPERLLWAARRGVVLHHLPALPAFEVLGGFFGRGIRTVATDQNFPDLSDLLQDWQTAATMGDLAALAALASVSANRTIALRQADQIPIAALARETGALGHVIAHTGSARGLIFAPGTVPDGAANVLRRAGLHHLVQFPVCGPHPGAPALLPQTRVRLARRLGLDGPPGVL